MSTNPTFPVFGDLIQVLCSAETTAGAFSVITQTCQPGSGPPPHHHRDDDEFFFPLSGSFEIFSGNTWTLLNPAGLFAARGNVHTFRNIGSTVGTMLIIASPGGLDRYLQRISPLSIPADLPELLTISSEHGVFFPGL